MKRFLLFLLIAIPQIAAGQDAHYLKNGMRYPLWFSRTKILIKFKDPLKFPDLANVNEARPAKRIELIYSIPDMAYIIFDSVTTKAQFESALASLRSDENILSAHPMLISESGEETAGLSDLVIARPKRGTSIQNILAVFGKYGLRVETEDTDSDKNYYLTGALVRENPFDVCEKLDATGLFEFTQPNCLRFIELAGNPNDPLFASNWGLAKMKMPEAWDITTGCSNIKIAIIDDGVQLNHPDLQPNLLPGFDATPFGTNGGTVAGEEQHGTKCAGFAAAKGNNGIGVTGVAYNSKIIPIRAFGTKAGGGMRTETLDYYIASAINHVVNVKNADILSMSWGVIASTTPINLDPVITAALNNAALNGRGGKGAILVAASGNGNGNYLAPIPGNVSDVLIIGASKSNDKKWEGANNPKHQVDVVAPGAYVTTTDISAYANLLNEDKIRTSWAAPAVAGIAALILSVNPSLTQSKVRRIIAETCDYVGGYSYTVGNGYTFPDLPHHDDMGYGRVNALKALEKAAGAPIIGPDLICTNGSYTLTQFPAGSSAVWSVSPGLSIAGNVATRQGNYSGPGIIYSKLTVPNACAPVTIKRQIWVGNPDITKTINDVKTVNAFVNPGNAYNLAAASSSPWTTFNYDDYVGTGDIKIDIYNPNDPTTFIYVHPSSTSGYRQIKVAATNTCGSFADDFILHLSMGNLKVFPNPAKDFLTLELATNGKSYAGQIQLFSESGTAPIRIIPVKTSGGDKTQISLDVDKLPRGTYYLHIVPDADRNNPIEKIRIILN